MVRRSGASFENAGVADLYHLRPPYPAALFQAIVDASPARDVLLDIGCGQGKMTRPLARHFGHATAVDPSARMQPAGRRLPGGGPPNIAWAQGRAETLVVARSPAFDAELRALVAPHARAGMLESRGATQLTLARLAL